MRRFALAYMVIVLLMSGSGESDAQLIMQPAIPTGPFTTTTPYATGMVDNTIAPGFVMGGRGGYRFRRGGVRRGRMYATPLRQQGLTRPRKGWRAR